MKSVSSLVEELFSKCGPPDERDWKADAKTRDYICSYLTAIKRGKNIVLRLLNGDLLAEMCLSGPQGRNFLEKINHELEQVRPSDIALD